MSAFAARLEKLNACPDAVKWVGDRDLATAWAECERGEWMLWLAGRVGMDRRVLVRAAVECVRPGLRYVKAGEDRPWYALEVALAWCDGRATLDEVRAAAYAADDVYAAAASAAYAYAAAASAAAAADDAYAYAADAAYACAYAYAYAYAAYAAAAAAASAAYAASDADAARKKSLRESADTVRRLIPVEVVAAAMEARP